MKTRLETLLEKYWEAETSLEEEKELKTLLKSTEGFESEKAMFSMLGEIKTLEPQNLSIPRKAKTRSLNWIGWAASVAILAGTVWFWQDYERKKQEELAYKQVMEALAQIQTQLSKGQEQLQPLNDLKYLNTTQQLFQNAPKQ